MTGAQGGESGQALDLTSCDREPIHLISAIQSNGFLIAISPDGLIGRVSKNAPAFLGRPVEELLGKKLDAALSPTAAHLIRNVSAMMRGNDAVERAFGVALQDRGPLFDLAVHRVGSQVVIEAEPCEISVGFNPASMIRTMFGRLARTSDLGDLLSEAALQVSALTGYDRVMIYRFHPDDSGEVVAEQVRDGLEPYLGLRYPASDIPRQARGLMVRNLVRAIADVAAEPSAIIPQSDPAGEPLDLSMSTLRAQSPVHTEYLRNMGVQATLTLSLVLAGRLWGIIACHHMEPRSIGYERRTTAELFAQMLAQLIENRDREAISDYEQRSRHMHNEIMGAVVENGSTAQNLMALADRVTQIVPCDGFAVRVADETFLTGETPTREEIAEVTRFLDQGSASRIFDTVQLGGVHPPACQFAAQTAGMLAIPISRTPRDYMMFFRRELVQSVSWAGDPKKPVEAGLPGARLSPRRSFEAWREIVSGQSIPWTEPERRAADALRVTFLEVVLRLTGAAEREREAATQRQNILIAELNHRVRNILGLIRGLITHSKVGATDIEGFAALIGDRIHSLAQAHDQITLCNWESVSLHALIATEMSAYLTSDAHRVQLAGPPILLQPKAFTTIALIVHELVTNSAKYGALSDNHGRVSVNWTREPSGDLVICWIERDGPSVRTLTRRGFGSTIIESSVPHDLGGQAEVAFEPAGLRARFVVPAEFVEAGAAAATILPTPDAPLRAAPAPARLSGSVLLVEDNIIIALDARQMLTSLGASRVEMASQVAQALRLIDLNPPSFALLDINLGVETSFPIAARLRELGVPWVFATGYGAELVLPAEFQMQPVVTKPYSAEDIAAAAGRSGLGRSC